MYPGILQQLLITDVVIIVDARGINIVFFKYKCVFVLKEHIYLQSNWLSIIPPCLLIAIKCNYID